MINKKRKVNKYSDNAPAVNHEFNYFIAKDFLIGKAILDIGCWTGIFENLIYDKAKTIYGIDPDKDAVAFAQKKFPKAKFQVGDANSLKFPKNSFDVVFYLEVIEHVPLGQELNSLREIRKVIKENGYLVLSTPRNNLISILLDPAYFLIAHRHYSEDNLTKMLTKAGFKVEKIYITSGWAKLISANIDLFYKHILKRKFVYPSWLTKLIEKEYYAGGFAKIHIIARAV